MYIEFTAEEQQRIQDIKNSFQVEVEAQRRAIDATKTDEERKRQVIQYAALLDRVQMELDAFNEDCQRRCFQQIGSRTEDIIANAKEQAPIILEYIHNGTVQDYFSPYDTEALQKAGIVTERQGKLYLKANYASKLLYDELHLHIDALQGDKAALQELLEVIIEAVEVSPYTDNTEITDAEEKPLDVKRFRRSPLMDITTYGLLNDKTDAQLLQDGDIFQQQADGQISLRWAVNQAPQGKEAVPVLMALTYVGAEGKVAEKLTGFDLAVYNAVSTRFYYWQRENEQKPLYITPQEIWRTMNGKRSGDGKAKPSKAQVTRICDSLDKMRFTRFRMDISEEIRAFNLHIDDERITSGTIDTYVLNSSKVEFTTDKGNTVSGYRIGEEPILYTYNKQKNRILYVPYELLDTSANTSDSENVTEFRNYLLQQIQLMKNAKEEAAEAAKKGKKGKYFKRNNIILLATIYKSTGILPPEERAAGTAFTSDAAKQTYIRKIRKADRQKIEGILDTWKAKGWINGYTVLNQNNEPVKERQQAKGYSIRI